MADGQPEGSARGMEPFVLLELAGGPAHGYELAQALSETGFRRIRNDASILHRLLRALETEGYATSSWERGESGPARQFYRLTPDGEAYLASRAHDLVRHRARIDTFLDRYRLVRRMKLRALRAGTNEDRPPE
jgi:PadR family transcriptional regulator PadR